jgi:hypothetical protein
MFQLFVGAVTSLANSRVLLFVLGLAVGGMLAVRVEVYQSWMQRLAHLWSLVVRAITGL